MGDSMQMLEEDLESEEDPLEVLESMLMLEVVLVSTDAQSVVLFQPEELSPAVLSLGSEPQQQVEPDLLSTVELFLSSLVELYLNRNAEVFLNRSVDKFQRKSVEMFLASPVALFPNSHADLFQNNNVALFHVNSV